MRRLWSLLLLAVLLTLHAPICKLTFLALVTHSAAVHSEEVEDVEDEPTEK